MTRFVVDIPEGYSEREVAALQLGMLAMLDIIKDAGVPVSLNSLDIERIDESPE